MQPLLPVAKIISLISIVLILSLSQARAQQGCDTTRLSQLFAADMPAIAHYHDHELGFVQRQLYGLYRMYKAGVSSQDAQSCGFTPSCSTYSMQSFACQPFFIALLATFDRLSRCHPRARGKYERSRSGFNVDPVR